MQLLRNELGFLRTGVEQGLKEEFKGHIYDVYVQQPVLDKNRQMVEIKSTVDLNTGKKVITHQAIFFRYNEMLLIQMMTFKEDKGLMKYYQDILNNFDI